MANEWYSWRDTVQEIARGRDREREGEREGEGERERERERERDLSLVQEKREVRKAGRFQS